MSLRGRASRLDFWETFLLAGILSGIVATPVLVLTFNRGPLAETIYGIVVLGSLLPLFGTMVRRGHDLNWSAKGVLGGFLGSFGIVILGQLVGWIALEIIGAIGANAVFFALALLPANEQGNAHGPPAVRAPRAS